MGRKSTWRWTEPGKRGRRKQKKNTLLLYNGKKKKKNVANTRDNIIHGCVI